MSKKFKRVLATLAMAAVVTVSAAASACTVKTKHPRAKITIEFNEETYNIEYTLYRNMYPQTVQHFIELADEGFYNNTIIHNYTSSDWFAGAYSYETGAENEVKYDASYTGSALAEYYEAHSKESAYYELAQKLTPSVYKQLAYDGDKQTVKQEDALPALIGEFSANDHKIEKGALTADYGTLKMFYYDKGDTNQKVAVKNSFGQILEHDYRYNCATSIFAIQAAESSSYSESRYCVFARLRNDKARTALNSLASAIEDYISDNLSTTSVSFTKTVTVDVDNLDSFASDGGQSIQTSFLATQKPIVVKSVNVTKY